MDAPATEVGQALATKDFDIAGVRKSHLGPVVGFIEKDSLGNGHVSEHLQVITPQQLISDATPMGDLLRIMKERQFTFVLAGAEVEGILTRADLNKPPIRVYLFGLISLLEMHMDFWLHHIYGIDSWKGLLSKRRLEVAEELLRHRKIRNHAISLIECLQICDKRDLLVANADWRNRMHLGSKSNATNLLKNAEELRDNVAHSQHDLARTSAWEELIELVERIEDFLERSDEEVELANPVLTSTQ